MKNKSIFLKEWERETENLAQFFCAKYFRNSHPEMWWVAGIIGGVLHINDYFFNLSDIVDFIRYDYTEKKMFEYYEYRMNEKVVFHNSPINIKNYLKTK